MSATLALGTGTLSNITTASNNLVVGNNAGLNIISGTGNIYLGNNCGNDQSNESNTLRIGDSGAYIITGNLSTGAVNINSANLTNTTNQLVLGTTNTTTISATAPSASRTYTLPDTGGSATFVLTSNAGSSGAVLVATSSTGAQWDLPLPITSGGTNSTTALSNNRLMISLAGVIKESPGLYTKTGAGTDLCSANNATFSMYNTGTIGQSGTTVTGSGTTFTAAMVGGLLFTNSTVSVIIVEFVSTTSLIVDYSQTTSTGTGFSIIYGGLQLQNSSIGCNNLIANGTQIILGSVTSGSQQQLQDQSSVCLVVNKGVGSGSVQLYNTSKYPQMQLMPFGNPDTLNTQSLWATIGAYYNGSWVSSADSAMQFGINVLSISMQFNYGSQATQNGSVSWNPFMTVNNTGLTQFNTTIEDSSSNTIYGQSSASATVTSSGAIAHSFTATFYKIGNLQTCRLTDNSATSNTSGSAGAIALSSIVPGGYGPSSSTTLTGYCQLAGLIQQCQFVFTGSSISISYQGQVGTTFPTNTAFNGETNYFSFV